MLDTAIEAPRTCARCATELSPFALACPACSALIHRAKLEELAGLGVVAHGRGRPQEARKRFQEALAL